MKNNKNEKDYHATRLQIEGIKIVVLKDKKDVSILYDTLFECLGE